MSYDAPPPPSAINRRGVWIALALITLVVGALAVNAYDSRSTSSTVTARPAVAQSAPTPSSSFSCEDIDASKVSALMPSDWDDWCWGAEWASDYFGELSRSDQDALCAEFWSTPDSELVATFTQEGNPRSKAIGAVDFMWTVC